MKKYDLSSKLKYILSELNMNKKEFLNACRIYEPSLSKPTILNAINGKNKNAPKIDTLTAIINVCKTSGNPRLKYISYDFLLNEDIQEVNAKNIATYQEIGLNDFVINKLKQFNHPFYYNYGNIMNYYFTHISSKYFQYLEYLKITLNIQNKMKNNIDRKEIIKIFSNDSFISYIMINFPLIYDEYLKLQDNSEINYNNLKNQIQILSNNLKYMLLELDKELYDNIEGE